MESPEQMLIKLNAILEAEIFPAEEFSNLMGTIKEQSLFKIDIFNFVYNNEKLLQYSRDRKTAYIKSAQYEMAARMRDMELKCLKLLDFKKERNIEKSMFYFENNTLIFLYFGNVKNDFIILKSFYKR